MAISSDKRFNAFRRAVLHAIDGAADLVGVHQVGVIRLQHPRNSSIAIVGSRVADGRIEELTHSDFPSVNQAPSYLCVFHQ